MIAVARDVTERKESEARERDYQERLEQAVHERTIELKRTTRELAESHHETLTRLALAANIATTTPRPPRTGSRTPRPGSLSSSGSTDRT